jgi:hypothetical protein
LKITNTRPVDLVALGRIDAAGELRDHSHPLERDLRVIEAVSISFGQPRELHELAVGEASCLTNNIHRLAVRHSGFIIDSGSACRIYQAGKWQASGFPEPSIKTNRH